MRENDLIGTLVFGANAATEDPPRTRDALPSAQRVDIARDGTDIAAGIKLIVHLARLRDGFRCVTRVSEIVGVKDGQFHVEDIFRFDQTGVSQDGRIQGHYSVTGYKPQCLSRLKAAGADISDSLFQARQARPEPAKA